MAKPFEAGPAHRFLMDFQQNYPSGGQLTPPWEGFKATGNDMEAIMELMRRMLGNDPRYGDLYSMWDQTFTKGKQAPGYDPMAVFSPATMEQRMKK